MNIIKDFLKQDHFDNIRNTLLSVNFPWYYHSSVAYDPSSVLSNDSLHNFQFVHSFYSNHAPNSPFIELLAPVLDQLSPAAIIKIKANLITRTESILEHDMHVDVPGVNCKTAILYINTNNGMTVFDRGEKVTSEENKIVIFDSDLKHTGTTCTDQKTRIVINFNYFES